MFFGPYCIDYTVDDETLDRYSSYTWTNPDGSVESNVVSYNSIENITVYNQDKQDITKLGGSFKIAYSYDSGEADLSDEGKVHRISDSYYYELADYKEISGFDSRKPFYIVVYRGSMRPEQFKGFYAKIDFQYLDNITATMEKYYGHIREYKYEKKSLGDEEVTLSGWYKTKDGSHLEGPEGSQYEVPDYTKHDYSEKIKVPTYMFELVAKRIEDDHAQEMLAYHHDGWRTYKTYSIVLTSTWEHEQRPCIELHKTDLSTNHSLYGAKYNVTLDIDGEDLRGNEINKTVDFTRVTNPKGYFAITTSAVESKGVYLGTFTGTIHAEFEETKAPAGHVIDDAVTSLDLELEDGKIIGGDSDVNETRNCAMLTLQNREGGTPTIQIAKVNKNNSLIEEACFEIHVAYTEPNGVIYDSNGNVTKYGKLVDEKTNIIRGQTKNGYLNITRSDLANMDDGFDISGYTGALTLQVAEVGVLDGGYSISSDSLSMTLEYKNGELEDYTENTDAGVLVHYLYDEPMLNIYNWAKGEGTLYKYVEESVNKWATSQMQNHGEMSYDDVKAWLVKYIEDNKLNVGSNTEEWKASTFTKQFQSNTGSNVVQLVVEDAPGSVILPDIPDSPKTPIFMEVAGTVFLDQTTSKAHENESDGKLTTGEELLKGIEVTLYEENGTLAKLVEEDGTVRANPTMTDENGFYRFTGVDPLKKYYVEFSYNGIEYRATDSSDTSFNSDEWMVSSKGSEVKSGRNGYNTVTPNTVAYDYYDIRGIYEEIANYTLDYINKNNSYPDWSAVRSYVSGNHREDNLIGSKLDYIKNVQTVARAGYSSQNSTGRYPHESLGDSYLSSYQLVNEGKLEIEFAGDSLKLLYPGQLQVNLGLVERDSTDLELLSDIVDTKVSMNRYDTIYDYNQGKSSYHQYIYEEDYNYETSPREDGKAYYTEDNVHFYITYENVIKNSSLTPTSVMEIIDYYNKELTWKSQYTTTKGNVIKGLEAWFNDAEITGDISVSNSPKYGIGTMNQNTSSGEYKANALTLSSRHDMKDGDTLRIRITYELVGDSDNAKEVLKKYLLQEREAQYSKQFDIPHFAEINAYSTNGGYLDMDSRPGNFVIADYEKQKQAYQQAYMSYLLGGLTEEGARRVKLELTRMEKIREDDAWQVDLILTNSGYVRTIKGNVWEAIDDKVKSSLDLQSEYGTRYVTWNGDSNLALGGIKVELVELLKTGDTENGANQVVRAVTTTNDDGSYEFKSFIAGDYTVRFVYGEDGNNRSKVTRNKANMLLPLNGQYYQSTKANPDTDTEKYWYSEKAYDVKGSVSNPVARERYSDAYDDSFSRLTQMNSKIENAENSTSSEYDYDGELEVELTRHTDPIYAYTSTMEIEIEYIRPEVAGDNNNSWYEYKINNIDFGLTPRAYNDMNIRDYVSNIKLYKEGETTPLIDVNFNEAGQVIDREHTVGAIYVKDATTAEQTLKEIIDIEYEGIAQNRSHLEITYKIVVTNDSLHDGEIYDTIKYIMKDGKIVGVVYYNEETNKLVSYESLDREAPSIIYHNDMNDNGYSTGLKGENRNQANITNARLTKYNVVTGFNEGQRNIITSRATNIVDFPNEPLDFTQKNHIGEDINKYWESTKPSDYVSSREYYKIENGEITWGGRNQSITDQNRLVTRSHIIRATNNSPLYKYLLPGESTTDELVLQHTLLVNQGDISGNPEDTNLKGTDETYSNLVEITRLGNIAGKITDIEGYDVTGKLDHETSKVRAPEDVDGDDPKYTPTISTGKSQVVVITPPTGLTAVQNAIHSNLGIVLIALVVLAAGIVLIKVFVIDSKKKEKTE